MISEFILSVNYAAVLYFLAPAYMQGVPFMNPDNWLKSSFWDRQYLAQSRQAH